MTLETAQSLLVWEGDDGYWHWDVRSPGLRSTGERPTWEEAYRAAGEEMAARHEAVTSGGL